MPDFVISTIPESAITLSDGAQLDGVTQGDGSHLVGVTLTINTTDWVFVDITDDDDFFADNDGSQRLLNDITYDGVSYAENARVEAEYQFDVVDPDGNLFTLVGFNINGGDSPLGSVEGLAFFENFPPVGVPLEVVSASEGPTSLATLADDYYDPPCFVAGTLIETPEGQRAVETLNAGDRVNTLDHGPQPLVWTGQVRISATTLAADPSLRPVRLESGLMVSPQHRILIEGWQAELYCGTGSVLARARQLVRCGRASTMAPETFPDGVTYCHIMFARHEVVFSNGIKSESFCPGPAAMRAMPDAAREFERLFPEFQNGRLFPPCRHQATGPEARLCCKLFEWVVRA